MKTRYLWGLLFVGALFTALAFTAGHADAGSISMAATVLSAQLVEDARPYPIDDHGKLRIQYFYYKNETGGTLADGTQIDLCKLPPGRKRILPQLCRFRSTAMGASRVLDIGLRAYNTLATPPTSADQAEDGDALVADEDISSAVNDAVFDAGASSMKYDVYSREEVTVFATVAGGTIPANAIVEGYIIYVSE